MHYVGNKYEQPSEYVHSFHIFPTVVAVKSAVKTARSWRLPIISKVPYSVQTHHFFSSFMTMGSFLRKLLPASIPNFLWCWVRRHRQYQWQCVLQGTNLLEVVFQRRKSEIQDADEGDHTTTKVAEYSLVWDEESPQATRKRF